MFFLNPSPLVFVEYWTAICLAAAVCGFPGRCPVGDGENGAVNDRDPDLGTAEQPDGHAKPPKTGGPSWRPVSEYRDGDGRKERYAVAKLSGHSELIDGFFHVDRRPSDKTQRGGRHRTTVGPNNATRGGKNVDRSDPRTATAATTAATPGPGQNRLFGNENECVSASDGRPCVCYTTDFLDSVTGLLLDEMTLVQDDTAAAVATFACPTYKAVPPAFVVSPPRPPETVETTAAALVPERSGDGNETAAPARKEVDFDYVVNYLLDKPKNDRLRVHYGLLGNVVKIRCADNSTGIYAVKWDYNKDKINSNATIVISDTNNLMISKLEPENSINYTCVTMTEAVKGLKIPQKRYTHYVIAIDKPIYEIKGTAFYKANGGGGCAREIIGPMIKQLPGLVQTEVCPEGSSRYACNVDVESSKCSENESLLEVNYVVRLNDKANYLVRIKTSKKGRNALFYQKLLARISNVFVENLKRTLAVKVLSKYSSIDTIFESDRVRTTVKTFVSCGPGFGIREVFCSACPPHHYSPDKSVDCLKCNKGFHQPVAGSVNCVKCPNRFASGCYVSQIPKRTYYVSAAICLTVCLLIAAVVCVCCCHKTNETIIESIRRNVKKKFRKSKKRELLVTDGTSDDSKSSGSSAVRRQYNKFLKFIKKSKRKVSNPNVPFHVLHENYGRSIPAVDARRAEHYN
ncbi:Immunoglobulin-like domain,Tyrosine-protein kinase ephrin type A/B receptor-like,Immunoglobulin-like [Cinara cedri]|uniref:Immunoglobulin-like domain,Tyrosine-protein kinase ephrin type A/B receptor-like,Immunoglobulin-like n=1 Tax=Cinara cedri TaxID=506608 RepID=A0A5E4MH55_9HEMI|nr:Immunoglobulin-like domain,Tyrosine-protein kinase ephrin type A/B receptor-like,Immunoglobulin-like [Cinara cedri]